MGDRIVDYIERAPSELLGFRDELLGREAPVEDVRGAEGLEQGCVAEGRCGDDRGEAREAGELNDCRNTNERQFQ